MNVGVYLKEPHTPESEYRPQGKQLEFHRSNAKHRAFFGGYGCGKSLAGCVEGLKTAIKYPGSIGVIARLTAGELKKTTWRDFKKIIPPELIQYENKSDFHILFKNKSEVYGFHCHSEEKLKSLNLDWIHIDEACEVSERIYHQFLARLRGDVGPRKIWLTGNPEGHNWIYNRFVAPKTLSPSHEYFHGTTTDAKFLPQDYIQSLYENYDEEQALRFIQGSWDVYEGQVFPMFTREMHVIEWEPEEIPREWARFRGLDHGFNDPMACLWVAKNYDGDLFVYREYYRKRRIIEENVANILEMSGDEEYAYTVMDPTSNKTESGTGRRIWDIYRDCGLVVVGGYNNLHSGVSRLRELFEPRAGRNHPTDRRRKRAPKLYVLAGCKETIRECQQYHYPKESDGKVNRERPVDRDNHTIDCLRYVVMHNPQSANVIKGGTMLDYMEHLRNKRDENGDSYHDVIGNEWSRR